MQGTQRNRVRKFEPASSPENSVELYFGYHRDDSGDGICDSCGADLTVTGSIFKSGIFTFKIIDGENKTLRLLPDNMIFLLDDNGELLYGKNLASFTNYKGSIVVPETVSYGGKTFTVTEIGADDYMDLIDAPFTKRTELTSVVLPNSVTRIGIGTFNDCSALTEIVIPENVRLICDTAFWGCENMKTVIFLSMDITLHSGDEIIPSNPFAMFCPIEAVYVPLGTADAYKEAWPFFAEIMEELSVCTYLDENGSTKETMIQGYISTAQTEYTTGWYVLDADVTFEKAVTVTGNVKLILCDGATLSANKGILLASGNSLTVYAKSAGEDMGKIIAVGDRGAAGIGGSFFAYDAGDLTVNGGSIKATGGFGAKGIGGGYGGKDGTVTNNGGTVIAIDGEGIIASHIHTFSTDYSKNALVHWRSAVCGHDVATELAEHTFGENGLCSVCGYKKADSSQDEAVAAAKAALDKLVSSADEEIKQYAETAKAELEELTSITAVTEKLTAAIAAINAKMTEKAIAAALQELETASSNARSDRAKATADAAKSILERAGSADEAEAVLTEALNKIAKEEKALADAKTEAKNAIDAAAGSEQSEAMKKIVSDAKENIENAKSVEEAENAGEAGLRAIEEQKQAEKEVTPGEKETCPDCGGTHADNFFGRIVCFFNRIINWFKNLFK